MRAARLGNCVLAIGGLVGCLLVVPGGRALAAGGEDCRALDRRLVHYEGHVELADEYYRLARGFVKDMTYRLAATNIVLAYKHAYIADLEGQVERSFERAPLITNSFVLLTRNQTISSLQNHYRRMQRNLQKLLGRLEVLRNAPGLDPAVRDWLSRMEASFKGAQSEDDKRRALGQMREGIEGSGGDFKKAAEQGDYANAVRLAGENPALSPELQRLLQSCRDGLTADEAARAAKAFYAGDLKTLLDLLKAHPDNPVLKEMVARLLRDLGLSPDDAVDFIGCWDRNDSGGLKRLAEKYPNALPLQELAGSGATPATSPPRPPQSAAPAPVAGAKPKATDSYVTPDGKPVDQHILKRFFNEDGSAKEGAVDVDYIGREGGQINYEQKVLFKFTRTDNPNVWVPEEVKGERIDWALQIREVERSKDGQTWHVTYKVQNLNGGAAAFALTKWVLTDPTGQSKSATGDQFKADITTAGTYTVEAHGQTGWGSRFIITESPTF
jgi:hypothetical protein